MSEREPNRIGNMRQEYLEVAIGVEGLIFSGGIAMYPERFDTLVEQTQDIVIVNEAVLGTEVDIPLPITFAIILAGSAAVLVHGLNAILGEKKD